MQERIKAYNGSEPFVFISYAHRDSDIVYPIIERLCGEGYRLWYDEGIPPTESWRAVINEHVMKCSVFMVFVSRNSMASREVIDECIFAVNLNKKLHIVYLEDVPNEQINYGIIAHFVNNQRLNRHELSAAEFERKLREPLSVCCASDSPAVSAPAEDNGNYSVVLISGGPNMLQAVKIIRYVTGLDIRASKEIANSAPVAVKEGVSRAEAEALKREFEEIEAIAEIRRI